MGSVAESVAAKLQLIFGKANLGAEFIRDSPTGYSFPPAPRLARISATFVCTYTLTPKTEPA